MKTIVISSEKSRLDISLIHDFLTNSYWATGRTLAQVKSSIDHSICYGVYSNGEQIGFARVVSDRVVFAYVMDVFILESERGNGYASRLMEHIIDDTILKQVSQWYLRTKDAHNLYSKYGFNSLKNAEMMMEKK